MSRIIRAAMVLGLLSACVAVPAARSMPDDKTMEELFNASLDSTKAGDAEARLRQSRVDLPPDEVPIVRHLLTQALISQRVSTPTLLACADTTFVLRGDRSPGCGMYVAMLARTLGDRKEEFAYADSLVWTRMRLAQGDRDEESIDNWTATLGRLYNRFGHYDSTIALLTPRAAAHPEKGDLHWWLGDACAEVGRLDDAIDEFVRYDALSWADTSVSAPLRESWAKRHGGFDGLEERLRTARAEARHVEVFVRDTVDRPAPSWTLPTLDGRRRSSRELAGRLVVLEFWGSWCGGCMTSLPEFVALTREPRYRDVTFLTVNFEPSTFGPNARARVRALMREKHWSFPVVHDSTSATPDAFGVTAYPTTVVIDRSGRMRFFDVGASPDYVVLRDQLAALLAEERASKRP